jgi:hypothetical protein
MGSLEEDFNGLIQRLSDAASVATLGKDPIFYFAYDPGDTLEVRRRMQAWQGRLQNAGWAVDRVSFADVLWQIIEESGRWDLWREVESEAEPEDIVAAVQDVLRQGDALIDRVRRHIADTAARKVVLLTDTEILNPFFRIRTLESALHDKVKTPTVIFYPGTRVGQYGLRFLGLYPEDSNYRATIFGGLP